MNDTNPIWQPSAEGIVRANLTRFHAFAGQRGAPRGDYATLWQWSVDDPAAFWSTLYDFTGVIADLRDFRDGMENAQRYLNDADDASASGLAKGEAAVEALTEANTFFASDHHYDPGRNNQDTSRGQG